MLHAGIDMPIHAPQWQTKPFYMLLFPTATDRKSAIHCRAHLDIKDDALVRLLARLLGLGHAFTLHYAYIPRRHNLHSQQRLSVGLKLRPGPGQHARFIVTS